MVTKGIHGGDIYRNRVDLDFSINMNPLGMPESVKEALHNAVDLCMSYPDPSAEALKEAVGRMLGVPEECLIFGNGASELFTAIVHGLKPKKIVIPVPSFYGYEHAAGSVGAECVYYEMKEEDGFLPDDGFFDVLTEDVDMVFLANPNNPTGGLPGRDYLKKLSEHCRRRGIFVILDECFIEFCGGDCFWGKEDEDACHAGNNSVIRDLAAYKNLVLVRAFTKIFSIPGVRLGYLLCSDETVREKIQRQLPEWNLSTFAQAAGAACAKENAFVDRTAGEVRTEREFLTAGLLKIKDSGKIRDLNIFPGTANFLLLSTSLPFYDRLLERGILVRDCANFRGLGPGYYRIAVKNRHDNEKLLKTIGEIRWTE